MRFVLKSAAMGIALSLLLVACGGGNDGPAAGQAPVASITSPAVGATFKAGDTISFAGAGIDPEDGALAGTRLTWWVNLHHDTHNHPLLLESVGASGSVTIPVRGETSDNIFYRFHLRATDSAGLTNEVTRPRPPPTPTTGSKGSSSSTAPPGSAKTRAAPTHWPGHRSPPARTASPRRPPTTSAARALPVPR